MAARLLDRTTLREAANISFFVALPLFYVASMYRSNFADAGGFFDLQVFWSAGKDVLAGQSPYPSIHEIGLGRENNFVYPAPMALLFAPLGLVSFHVAAALFTSLLFAAVAGSLWVLGIRDWRCYGAALLPMTTMTAISTGTLSPFIVLGAAVVWRYRDNRAVAGAATGAVVVAKLFMWPLLVWLVATRRRSTATKALAIAVAASAVGWLALSFAGFMDYPSMLATLTRVEGGRSYSLFALLLSAGASTTSARVGLLVAGAALVAAIIVIGRRPGGDERSFGVALAASLLLSPIVWAHYFILLLIPIALSRPRLSPLWFAPLAFWLTTYTAHSQGSTARIVTSLGIMLAIFIRSGLRNERSSILRAVEPVPAEAA
jgi:alpha-1,2-mannosyltransferase